MSISIPENKMKHLKPISQNPSILNLPTHIFHGILLRLPTKSIISCKLVCKLWRSIINDPHFSISSCKFTLIVRRIGDNHANKNLHLIEPEYDVVVRKREGKLCLVLGKEAVIRINDDYGGVPIKELEIVNSCEGLVCLRSGRYDSFIASKRESKCSNWGPFYVCNPVMSDYVVVNQTIPCVERDCGFGFSTKSKQYKVLRVYKVKNKKEKNGDDGYVLGAEVFSLGSNEGWRRVDDPPAQKYSWVGKGTYFQGALHWIVLSRRRIVEIVAFDFDEEKFSLVSYPTELGRYRFKERPYVHLATLQSRLCFCLWTYKLHCDIWIMDEYGVKDSWRNLFVVLGDKNVRFDFDMPLKPLANLKSGEILMLSASENLVSYDVGSNSWRAFKIPGVTEKVEAMLFDPVFVPTEELIARGGRH